MAPSRLLTSILACGLLAAGALIPGAPAHAEPQAGARIVNGVDVDAASWEARWQPTVALVTASDPDNASAQFCGGTVIHPRWVLTAAHCLGGRTAAAVQVLAGTTDLTDGGQRLTVTEIIRHPSYNPGVGAEFDHDVALLRLASDAPVPAMPLAWRAPSVDAAWGGGAGLGDPTAPQADQVAWAAGWGLTEVAPQTFPDILQEVGSPVIADAACAAGYGPEFVASRMVCASILASELPEPLDNGLGHDACSGDSGGPLIVYHPFSAQWVQLGITSFGPDECGTALYGAYAKVPALIGFITQHVPISPGRIAPTQAFVARDSPVALRAAWSAPHTRSDMPIRLHVRDSVSGQLVFNARVGTGSGARNVTGLHPGRVYLLRARAEGGPGASPWTAESAHRLPRDRTPPTFVRNRGMVVVTRRARTALRVGYPAARDNHQVAGYIVQVRPRGGRFRNAGRVRGARPGQVNVTRLRPGTAYQLRVVAVDASGNRRFGRARIVSTAR